MKKTEERLATQVRVTVMTTRDKQCDEDGRRRYAIGIHGGGFGGTKQRLEWMERWLPNYCL